MGPGEASGPQAPAHSELTLRVLSAIVLGAFVLGLTWWGGWPFAVFWLLAGLAILYEWLRMVDAKPFAPLAVALGIALVVAAGLLFVGSASVWLLVPTGIGLAASLGLGRTRHDRLWAFAGALCAAVLVLVPPAIRAPAEWGLFGPNLGRDILFLLYGIVWATDIGAYFVGRAVGGPKLMPKVSPKKTWSGALGGLAAAVLTNVVLLKVSGASLSARVLFAAAALSVVSQIGDLMESALKRHFGAKDSSHLIPGHGGVMDRLDGFFAVCAILLAWFFVEFRRPMTRTLTILGATGSIGRSTEAVVAAHPGEFRVEAVVGGRDAEALAGVARRLRARFAALADEGGAEALKAALAGSGIEAGAGEDAVLDAVQRDCDIVMAAISGTAGLKPTKAALKAGRRIALANKESLVCAGTAFMTEAARVGAEIYPVDSEHNALFQALAAGRTEDVAKAILTATGGPFRTWTRERIAAATPAEAAAHPVWSMGAKINIDSATLMNKGLELIEAHHLFGIDAGRLDVLVHPEAIVHGLIQWRDGVVTAGLALPDMRIPIGNALRHEGRLPQEGTSLDLAAISRLSFEPADEKRFPCLTIARAALAAGGAMPTILNAANEIAVAAYVAGRIGFYGIGELVESVCERMAWQAGRAPGTIVEALAVDGEARRLARSLVSAGKETAP